MPGASSVILDGDETHHLVHVLRVRRGAPARVFDGEGHEWEGHVESLDRRGAVLDGLRPVAALAEPAVAVTVIAGLLRGAAMDTLVRDAVTLGARAIVPAHTEFSSVSRRADALASLVARWRRIAIGACKQCGRAVVPDLVPPEPLAAALRRPAAVRLILVEPTSGLAALRRIEDLAARARDGGAAIAIGPEGGWGPADLERASQAGFLAWSLGTQVLRAEHVPVAALAIARYAWEGSSQGPDAAPDGAPDP
jgi:16S rRNA (uracil1498-N3)-methyltransferase